MAHFVIPRQLFMLVAMAMAAPMWKDPGSDEPTQATYIQNPSTAITLCSNFHEMAASSPDIFSIKKWTRRSIRGAHEPFVEKGVKSAAIELEFAIMQQKKLCSVKADANLSLEKRRRPLPSDRTSCQRIQRCIFGDSDEEDEVNWSCKAACSCLSTGKGSNKRETARPCPAENAELHSSQSVEAQSARVGIYRQVRGSHGFSSSPMIMQIIIVRSSCSSSRVEKSHPSSRQYHIDNSTLAGSGFALRNLRNNAS